MINLLGSYNLGIFEIPTNPFAFEMALKKY